ncbi:MAG: TIGR02921 family PEP-CTERM protein, partial [Chloroflexales bacterium]|nr:TIGR02921 family PEP-CTERM protein [Chloroflexales bacterium]
MRRLLRPSALAKGLFWGWHVIFLAFMLLGFAPLMLGQLLDAVRAKQVPASFLLYAALLIVIPVAMAGLGIWLRKDAGRLFMLAYGVEGPLMLLLAVRFFIVRDATPTMWLLLGVAGVGLLALLWDLLDKGAAGRGLPLRILRAAGLSLLVAVGLYASLWFAFYAVPLASYLLRSLEYTFLHPLDVLRSLWQTLTSNPIWLPFQLLAMVLWVFTAALLVGVPLALPIIYTRRWLRALRDLAGPQTRAEGVGDMGGPAPAGLALAIAVPAVVLTLAGGAFALSLGQPQHAAFALLSRPAASAAERDALLARAGQIRAGLLNAYLAPQRYISTAGGVEHVSGIYRDALSLNPEQAAQVQRLYEGVARPILYEPAAPPEGDAGGRATLEVDQARAAELYESFFDQPISDAERPAIVRAVRSTWSLDQASTAWQLVDDREIHLLRQELSVAEHGDWAEVELYEVYQNQTSQQQEVVYYFSLPESAVLTGLWLGNGPEREQRFVYQVAPRGAAQAVYQSEVRRSVDPALLEQIGPRQYRLRVFPVQQRGWRWQEDNAGTVLEDGPPLHMWLRWQVLADNGAWPMPRLAELRNVYWDEGTERVLNGTPMAVAADAWLPASVPASAAPAPREHYVAL